MSGVVEVAPGRLRAALAAAPKGQPLRLYLLPGRHRGGISAYQPLHLSAHPDAVLVPSRALRSFLTVSCTAAGETPAVVLEGLSFRGGVAWKGAAVRVLQGHVHLKSCTFEGLRSIAEGAAIFVDGGAAVRVSGCRFTSGRALAGGAICASPGSSLSVEDSSFVGNRGRCGGALAVEAATAEVLRCYFEGNRVANCGPALAGRGLGSALVSEPTFGPTQSLSELQSEDQFFSLKVAELSSSVD